MQLGVGVHSTFKSEDNSYLGVSALLSPPHDGVLSHKVGIVEDADDVCEQFQQLAVLVAAHLRQHITPFRPILYPLYLLGPLPLCVNCGFYPFLPKLTASCSLQEMQADCMNCAAQSNFSRRTRVVLAPDTSIRMAPRQPECFCEHLSVVGVTMRILRWEM